MSLELWHSLQKLSINEVAQVTALTFNTLTKDKRSHCAMRLSTILFSNYPIWMKWNVSRVSFPLRQGVRGNICWKVNFRKLQEQFWPSQLPYCRTRLCRTIHCRKSFSCICLFKIRICDIKFSITFLSDTHTLLPPFCRVIS